MGPQVTDLLHIFKEQFPTCRCPILCTAVPLRSTSTAVLLSVYRVYAVAPRYIRTAVAVAITQLATAVGIPIMVATSSYSCTVHVYYIDLASTAVPGILASS